MSSKKKPHTPDTTPAPTTRFPTSREVFDRIRWDHRIDAAQCVIGYQERLSTDGTREKPFLAWNPDGDIPWHRILYFRTAQTTLWHRSERIQNLDAVATETPTAAQPVAAQTSEHAAPLSFDAQPLLTFAWNGQEWATVAADSLSAPALSTKKMSAVTFNVLFDQHGLPAIDNNARRAALVEVLLSHGADIIALQEVTPDTLAALLNHPDIRSRYYSSSAPGDAEISQYGLLLLCARPFVHSVHRYSPHKSLLIADLDNGLRVITLHLTSSRAANDAQKRELQLATLCQCLADFAGDALVLGDFNDPRPEQAPALTQQNAQDVWLQFYPDDPGYTFDPQHNPLAAALTTTGRPARFDRMALRAQRWRALNIARFAADHGGVFVSDHFGLRAELEPMACPWEGEKPTYHTALLLIPPEDIWEPIQRLRQKYDRSFDRWMPHINLVYGFINAAHFDAAVPVIERALASVQPFEVTLEKLGRFGHKASQTVWVGPTPAEPIQQLQGVLQKLFPVCDEQQKKEQGFRPHLTLGQTKKEADAEVLIRDTQAHWRALRWQVDEVCLIARTGDSPFEIKQRVKLGALDQQPLRGVRAPLAPGGSGQSPARVQGRAAPADTPQKQEQQKQEEQKTKKIPQQPTKPTLALTLGIISDVCEAALRGERYAVHVLGSHRLGVASAASDLDVVCAAEGGPNADVFLQDVSLHLKALGAEVRDATDALVPIIKARLEGQAIDVQYARLPKGLDPSDLKKLPWERLDEQSWRALVGCREADILLAEAHSITTPEAFRALLIWWRSWTATQQITGNAWCLPGSFSWAVAVVWALDQWVMKRKRALSTDLREMVAATFNMLANRDSARPIGLSDEALQYKPRGQRDRWPVITSCAPCQNSARSVTASTAHLLDATLRRASDLATRAARGDNAAWDALHAVQSPSVLTPHIQLQWADGEARGWIEGHFTGLIVALEQEHGATLRPWPPRLAPGSEAVNCLQIDLGAIPVQAALATARAWLVEEGATGGVSVRDESTPAA